MKKGKASIRHWHHVAAFGSALMLGTTAHAQLNDKIWVGPTGDGSGNHTFNASGGIQAWSPAANPGANDLLDTNTTHVNVITLNVTEPTIGGFLIRQGDTYTHGTGATRRLIINQTLNVAGTISLTNASSNTNPLFRIRYLGTQGMTVTSTGLVDVLIVSGGSASRTTQFHLEGASTQDITVIHTNQGTVNIAAFMNGSTPEGTAFVNLLGEGSIFDNHGAVNVGDVLGSSFRVTGAGAQYRQSAGTTTLGTIAGSNAQMWGGIVSVTGGIFKGTGTVQGVDGSNLLTMTVSGTGTLAPGASVGRLTLDANTAALNFTGGTYEWELGALSTANPGVDYDQIVLAGGNLAITGGVLKPVFIGSASAPDAGDPFWNTGHSWVVIDNIGSGTASGTLAVDNSAWSHTGNYFETVVSGNSLLLNWVIPEPASLSLLALGGLMLLRRRRTAGFL